MKSAEQILEQLVVDVKQNILGKSNAKDKLVISAAVIAQLATDKLLSIGKKEVRGQGSHVRKNAETILVQFVKDVHESLLRNSRASGDLEITTLMLAGMATASLLHKFGVDATMEKINPPNQQTSHSE